MNKPESCEMVLVPREPTEAMLAAADKLIDCDPLWVAKAYRAMVRVAQAVPSEQPIAEQPKADSVYLGSAGPSEDLQTALPEGALSAENQWLGDMMILQVLADSEHVNEQEREVLTRWMESSSLPLGESAGEVPSHKKYLPSMTPPAASLPVSAPAGVRMLTWEEREEIVRKHMADDEGAEKITVMLQRKFCEVNGLKLAAMSATTKEN